MPEQPAAEPAILHELKNHLAIVIGFGDFLLTQLPEEDPRHTDLLEVLSAARAAMALMPQLAERIR